MHLAPPPSPGSRIQELGDTLVVRFRPRRSWGDIVFLGFWLTGWTLGGIAVLYALTQAGWGGRAFLLLWLCGWAFGEVFAAKQIAWQLVGREFLLVTANQLEIRKEIGSFARTRRLHALSVDDVRAQRVPTDEEEKPRRDYRLEIVTRDDTVYVGEGMGEREAEYTASVVESRVRPHPRWIDKAPEFGFAAPPEAPLTAPDQSPTPELSMVRSFEWPGAHRPCACRRDPDRDRRPESPAAAPPPARHAAGRADSRVHDRASGGSSVHGETRRRPAVARGLRRAASVRRRNDALCAQLRSQCGRVDAEVRREGDVDDLVLPRPCKIAGRPVRRPAARVPLLRAVPATADRTSGPNDRVRPREPAADRALTIKRPAAGTHRFSCPVRDPATRARTSRTRPRRR